MLEESFKKELKEKLYGVVLDYMSTDDEIDAVFATKVIANVTAEVEEVVEEIVCEVMSKLESENCNLEEVFGDGF